jgi:hypothetical protein
LSVLRAFKQHSRRWQSAFLQRQANKSLQPTALRRSNLGDFVTLSPAPWRRLSSTVSLTVSM